MVKWNEMLQKIKGCGLLWNIVIPDTRLDIIQYLEAREGAPMHCNEQLAFVELISQINLQVYWHCMQNNFGRMSFAFITFSCYIHWKKESNGFEEISEFQFSINFLDFFFLKCFLYFPHVSWIRFDYFRIDVFLFLWYTNFIGPHLKNKLTQFHEIL